MQRKNWKKLFSLTAALLMLLCMMGAAEGSGTEKRIEEEPMYPSFIYTYIDGSTWAVEAPAPYRPTQRVDSETLGTALGEPADVFSIDGELFIADKANSQIIQTDAAFQVVRVIKDFIYNGKTETFAQPEGVYATQEKIYIADTGHQRIVVLNRDGSCSSIITTPQSDILPDDLVFAPQKVAADAKGRVYAVVKGVYEGIMELYEDGSFGGFVGSIPVKPDPLTLLWKTIMTKEQRAKLENFIPVEYTNLTLDKDGFIYTVSLASEETNSIRRLNAAGDDILARTGLHSLPINGVLPGGRTPAQAPSSSFVDIDVADNGLYYALDAEYGRVFAYDMQGNLLFVFGGKNTGQSGTFQKAASIALLGDKVCVADSTAGNITVFERTEYASQILRGIELYNNDQYEECIEAWNEVLRYNSHFILAYSKIGNALYQMEDYPQAMEYYQKAIDQPGYSKAFTHWRENMFSANFVYILLGVIAVIVLLMLARFFYKRWRRTHPVKRDGIFDRLTYPLYVLFHPFDGFWDLKYEKRGRAWVSTLLIALTIVTFAVERGLSGFSNSSTPDAQLDIIYELKFVLVPLALFLVANLSITTLMDGKGTFKELYTAAGYALTPLILIKLPMTLVSNLLTQEEGMYITLMSTIAFLWVAILLFAALSCTHEYTASKTVGTIALTAVAMVIICFICVLFFFLFTELVGFVYTILEELQYR